MKIKHSYKKSETKLSFISIPHSKGAIFITNPNGKHGLKFVYADAIYNNELKGEMHEI
jgi:hypothetical protein